MKKSSNYAATHFVILLFIFIVPMIAGYILYFYHDHFKFKTTNHGVLIKPINIQQLGILDPSEKKWRVMYIFNKDCDASCKKSNFELHQMHKALGKEHDRVKILFVNGENNSIKNLKLTVNPTFTLHHKIYLIDPIGNVFMYYPDTVNPIDILKDLKKVLEVSQIG